MEVILLERVAKLGQMGDVVNVKPGFARNFLLPKGKALRATQENRKRFETQRVQLEARNLELRKEADAVGEKLNGHQFVIIRQAGEMGQLYGSVAARDLSDLLTAGGFSVQRQQVRLDTPIKTLTNGPQPAGSNKVVAIAEADQRSGSCLDAKVLGSGASEGRT